MTLPQQSFAPARVAALVRGDRAAREEFFDYFYGRVYRYVARTVRNGQLAEDLTHDIFLKLHRTLHRFDPERDPACWVFTVATNAMRDHWRRQSTRDSARSIDLDELRNHPSSDHPPVDELLIEKENSSRIHRALAGLSEDDREILVLRNWAELDVPQIGKMLSLRPDAVRQRWSRALRRLGDAYQLLEAREAGEP